MLFRLNTEDDRPIYLQIADQVTYAVASGVLRPGDLVPSVRELSRMLVVNPNTVARAYRELQGKQLLESVRGTGLQVTEQAPAWCRAERREAVRVRLRTAIEEARRSELAPDEIEAILREEWVRTNGSSTPGGNEKKGES